MRSTPSRLKSSALASREHTKCGQTQSRGCLRMMQYADRHAGRAAQQLESRMRRAVEALVAALKEHPAKAGRANVGARDFELLTSER
eukprot:1415304-Prymnesium_polylepis.1